MAKLKIKKQSPPERCEICHQNDCFDPATNTCQRCNGLTLRNDTAFQITGANLQNHQITHQNIETTNYTPPIIHPALIPSGIMLGFNLLKIINIGYWIVGKNVAKFQTKVVMQWLVLSLIYTISYIVYALSVRNSTKTSKIELIVVSSIFTILSVSILFGWFVIT